MKKLLQLPRLKKLVERQVSDQVRLLQGQYAGVEVKTTPVVGKTPVIYADIPLQDGEVDYIHFFDGVRLLIRSFSEVMHQTYTGPKKGQEWLCWPGMDVLRESLVVDFIESGDGELLRVVLAPSREHLEELRGSLE